MTSQVNSYKFDGKIGDEEVKLEVRRPSMEEQREGQKVYNRAFSDAVSSGALLRAKLEDFMRKQGMWDSDKQTEMEELGQKISNLEKSLLKGGIKLTQAKSNAIELRALRMEMRDLIAERTELDVHTAEGQADNARFNYWVSCCLVYNDNQKPVFKNTEDYVAKQNDPFAVEGASKLASLLYNLSADYENGLTENKFLREFGFADDKNRLINKEGKLVDIEGRVIDEQGYLLNEEGQRVDFEGNLIDAKGNYAIERQPFLDEDDAPIKAEEAEEEAEPAEEEQVAETK